MFTTRIAFCTTLCSASCWTFSRTPLSTVSPLPKFRLSHSKLHSNVICAAKAPPQVSVPDNLAKSARFLTDRVAEVVLSLKITGYDVVGIVICLFFPWLFLRALHGVYHWIVRLVDRIFRHEEREQAKYEESMFRLLEQESRILALVSIGNLTISLIATILSLLGVMRPTVLPSKIRQLSHVLYFGWVASKIKSFTIERSQKRTVPFLLKNDARRFLYNRVSDVLIVVVCVATCLDILGVPFQSLLLSGGVGGLVLGLAAKELAENILGGCLLSIVGPFTPGDYIRTNSGGETILGRVVRVGWYKTTILGLDQVPIDVPNQLFVSSRITNLSRVKHRRLMHNFCLRNRDISRVQEVINRLRYSLMRIPSVDPTVGLRVHFIGYLDSNLEIQILAFIKDEGIDKFFETQQFVLLEIARVVKETGTQFAYPTHAVDIYSADPGRELDEKESVDMFNIESDNNILRKVKEDAS